MLACLTPLPTPPLPALPADALVLAYLESKEGPEFKTFTEVAEALRNGASGRDGWLSVSGCVWVGVLAGLLSSGVTATLPCSPASVAHPPTLHSNHPHSTTPLTHQTSTLPL